MLSGIVWRMAKSLIGSPKYRFVVTETSRVQDDMKKLTDLVESGEVKPLLDDSQQFELTTESLQAMIKASMSHRAKGKLVLTVVP
jgi:NADPH:quinone reductase-like Zn-dependent oxidoreductase